MRTACPMPFLTRPPPCPRAAAVTAAFWPLGSITSAEPGHVSRLGMMAERPLPLRLVAMVMKCRSSERPTIQPGEYNEPPSSNCPSRCRCAQSWNRPPKLDEPPMPTKRERTRRATGAATLPMMVLYHGIHFSGTSRAMPVQSSMTNPRVCASSGRQWVRKFMTRKDRTGTPITSTTSHHETTAAAMNMAASATAPRRRAGRVVHKPLFQIPPKLLPVRLKTTKTTRNTQAAPTSGRSNSLTNTNATSAEIPALSHRMAKAPVCLGRNISGRFASCFRF
jgi:hypothetical protein